MASRTICSNSPRVSRISQRGPGAQMKTYNASNIRQRPGEVPSGHSTWSAHGSMSPPMLQRHLTGLALAFGIIVVPALASAHPLDPLTADEVRAAARITRMDGRLAAAQFASILLNEPAKAAVIDWRPGQ